MRFLRPVWAAATTSAVGAATWFYVSQVSHRHEAWDDEIYFTTVLPVIAAVAAIVAFIVPEKPWRWAMIPFAAQALVAFLQNPTANLMPLGLIMFAIFGGLCAIPAALAAMAARRFRR
jgi:hypothetical protein